MSLSNFLEELLLKWVFTTSTATRPTAWFVALHTGDPGETGAANEVLVGTDADYVRKAITYADPVADSGQALSNAAVSWTAAVGASNYTVTHVSVHDALTGGNCFMYGALLVARDMVASGVLTFSTGDIIQSLD